MLKKILIANRGEIACRIIKTAKRLGLKTVAVYSDADANALHVKHADEAYHIGASPSKDSYLVSEKILSVAKRSGADCIHPGYGFLSENDQFAEACAKNNIVFIGPPAAAITAMGSKSRSKEIMAAANVPLVPGYYGQNQDPEFLKQEAIKIGFPVLIKAAFGGGGKGMRVVEHADEFQLALQGAQREAIAGFGNDLVLLERYVTKPRHVEVQVFADSHGHCVYLGDRDCSLQRRHQKVIEEAPAPMLSDSLRKAMGEAAVRCAQAINYVGAGTVEFLLCGNDFFFMEMNTRLQVEHPVTEMVTGVDLVEWQIKIASGQALSLTQEQVTLSGHALEARIYAEDPSNEFIPCSGTIKAMLTPLQNKHIRVDTGVQAGAEISSFYDPMIAKLIVWDETRPLAIKRLQSALEQFHLAGFSCNVEFLHKLASHEGFVTAQPDTHFIAHNLDELTAVNPQQEDVSLVLASLLYLSLIKNKESADAWDKQAGFRLNQHNKIHIALDLPQTISAIEGQHGYVITLDGNQFAAQAFIEQQSITATINGEKYTADFYYDQEAHAIDLMYLASQHHYKFKHKHYISEIKNAAASLAAPLNGTVVKHLCEIGSQVTEGMGVVVIEAMKMEYTLAAPFDGQLMSYCFAEGELVTHGAMLAIVEASPNND
ncbi:acetyl/propionyl/methylcrotonyl-CoA carboxylase subunit alpha [Pseudoalteromonas tunicata]|uniref:Biotin carboxylase n=3 Tax=Pseudoalteromonas tunicata TaxID=314281 RepID=A4C9N1_9GAMM|nr:acetyl-CoA carboxylase biotin carboxylase subunit [Pseudoalteromonas tunicata]ATC94634.1 3-methylcrotonyl-CoA carboxylase alpha subunit [Pseudoalteromonas tunicata]AXT30356.1 acetyl/propionyl/methylcrotonyl-CoA carboxylase subunit alpha [Pseudoalteromonas tunicata]EAR28089.1 urea carboxylase (alpha subunit) [Pseudoalteromonas tunicata D2]